MVISHVGEGFYRDKIYESKGKHELTASLKADNTIILNMVDGAYSGFELRLYKACLEEDSHWFGRIEYKADCCEYLDNNVQPGKTYAYCYQLLMPKCVYGNYTYVRKGYSDICIVKVPKYDLTVQAENTEDPDEALALIDKMDIAEFINWSCRFVKQNGHTEIDFRNGDHRKWVTFTSKKEGISYAFICTNEAVSELDIMRAYTAKGYYNCHASVLITDQDTEEIEWAARHLSILLWNREILREMIGNTLK